MINGLKPYPELKDSGVEWLGEVPAHWQVVMVKQNYTIQLGKMLQPRPNTPQDVEIPYLKAQHVQWFHVRTTDVPKMWAGQKDIAQFGVASGDLLVCEGGEGGRCGILRQDVEGYIIQNALHRVRSREQSRNDYLQYVMSSVAATGWFDALNNKATIAHFTKEKFGALRVPVPPPPEQTAIVRFLDHADRRIRRYIRAKQKLIALLEEQKQAIIHQAVTGQIDVRTGQPYPVYKPSGVEWLGDVPAHWKRRRLKALLKAVDRRSLTGRETLLSLRRDYGVVVYADHFSHPSQSASLIGFKLLKAGQLVVNRLQANNGLIFSSTLDGLVSPDYSVFDARLPVQMRFLSELCRTSSYRAHFRRVSTGLGTGTAGFLRLYDDRFLDTVIFLPPYPEQTGILEFFEKVVARSDGAIDRTGHQIDLIHEYRTRLIADVVTGKLDVREAAATLPEGDPLAAEDNLDGTLETGTERNFDKLDAALEEAIS